jgi:transcriptional regulator with XRE-family HTH domain
LIVSNYGTIPYQVWENSKKVNRLKKIREKRGVSREELAGRLGVTKRFVERWESGQSDPDLSFLSKIVTILNCKISEILPEVSAVAKVDAINSWFVRPKLEEKEIKRLKSSLEFRREFNFKKYTILMTLLNFKKGR